LAALVFGRLSSRLATARLITAQPGWLSYRRADCLSLSDVVEGGSQHPSSTHNVPLIATSKRIKNLNVFSLNSGEPADAATPPKRNARPTRREHDLSADIAQLAIHR
jgi:hypothetical protein